MSQPPAYTRQYNFTDFSASNPEDQQPGVKLDAEYDAIQRTLAATLGNLSAIQRDDGALANGVVTPDSFSTAAQALLVSGIVPKGNWVTATGYGVYNLVTQSALVYICITAHTSGTFATDLAAGKWMLWGNAGLQDGNAFFQKFSGNASQVTFTLSANLGTDENNLMVFVGGTIKDPSVDYTVNGTALTFAVAPASASNNIFVFSPNKFLGAAQASADAAAASAASILANASFIAVTAALGNIATVAGVASLLSTVSGMAANISTVANIATDITAAAAQTIKSNRIAIVDPAVTNDSASGYSAGSVWINTVSDQYFICVDAAPGAAKWIRQTVNFVSLGGAMWLTTPDGDLTSATNNIMSYQVRRAFHITNVYAHVEVSGTTSVITVDVNKNGTTIFSTLLTIDANESDSATALNPCVIASPDLAANDVITFDIDLADSGNTGAGLQVEIFGYYTA